MSGFFEYASHQLKHFGIILLGAFLLIGATFGMLWAEMEVNYTENPSLIARLFIKLPWWWFIPVMVIALLLMGYGKSRLKHREEGNF